MEGSKIKLKQAYIYGFGPWVDKEMYFPNESYSLIYGENEAGKSSLQQFILFMLFGLPPKKRQFYYPKTSSKMGGRLIVEDRLHGEIEIERLDSVQKGAAVCRINGNTVKDESWLKEQLAGMNNSIYESIYSFSALDLIQLRKMKSEDFGEILFNIALTGATNVQAIEKKLDSKLAELFKQAGKIPKINVQIEHLEQMFREWKRLEQEESVYRDKTLQLSQRSEEIEQIQTDINDLRRKLISIQKITHALPTIYRHYQQKEKLEQLPLALRFPEDGRRRLQAIKDPLLSLKSERAVLCEQEKIYINKHTKLKQSHVEEANYLSALNLQQKYKEVVHWKQQMVHINKSIKTIDAQLAASQEKLHMPVNIEQIKATSFPFYLEKKWSEIKQQTEQVQLEKEQLQQIESELKIEANQLQKEIETKRERVLPEADYDKLKAKVNRALIHEQMHQSINHTEKSHLNWKKTKTKRKQRAKQVCFGSILFTVGLVLVDIFLMEISILIPALFLILAIGFGQLLLTNRTIKTTDAFFKHLHSHQTINVIEHNELDRIQRILEEQEELKNEVSMLQKEKKKAQMELLKLEEKQRALEIRNNRTKENMNAQYEAYPFLSSVEPAFWPEVYHMLKQIVQMMDEKEEMQRNYKSLEKREEAFVLQLIHFLKQHGKYIENKPIEAYIEQIERFTTNYTNTLKDLEHYEQLIIENKEKKERIEQKITTYENEIYGLFKQANVRTEDAYFEVADLWDEQVNIQAAYKESYEELRVRFSKQLIEKWQKEVPDAKALEQKERDVKRNLQQLEAELEKKRQQAANLQAEIGNLERSEALSYATYRLEIEKEKLQNLAQEWAVYKTAKEMLGETKRNYRQKYLHAVLKKTTIYFSYITNQQYKKVYEPTEKEGFRVETEKGLIYRIDELSQGTIDQLYISLRIAVSELMSEKHRLPFIMDDPFVHFDLERTKRMMKVIQQVSKDQQIILFTCKKELLDWADAAHIIHLGKTEQLMKQ
ncbi:AAA family ATPase [Virgibacillus sp. W0430]|uniref:ATP-binding protein n=1 Tax=Virgibacillus sp. W0430 TaxID=3391580 RepID=UPI003F48CE3B